MCLQSPELGDECFWAAQTSSLQLLKWDMNSRPSFLEEWCSCLGFFFCTLFRGKNTRLVCSVLFSLHVAHTWELMYHRLRALSLRVLCKFSGRSFPVGHHPLGRGSIAVVSFYLEVEAVGTVCYLPDCLFWAQGDAGWHQWSKFTSYVNLAQLMPAKCKPWKCKIKPFLIIQQHLSLPGLPSFFFWVPLMEHHYCNLKLPYCLANELCSSLL